MIHICNEDTYQFVCVCPFRLWRQVCLLRRRKGCMFTCTLPINAHKTCVHMNRCVSSYCAYPNHCIIYLLRRHKGCMFTCTLPINAHKTCVCTWTGTLVLIVHPSISIDCMHCIPFDCETGWKAGDFAEAQNCMLYELSDIKHTRINHLCFHWFTPFWHWRHSFLSSWTYQVEENAANCRLKRSKWTIYILLLSSLLVTTRDPCTKYNVHIVTTIPYILGIPSRTACLCVGLTGSLP